MKFTELQDELKEKFGATKLADIAREFDVTPQVVSNWKSRNYVPYKYVQSLRKKIRRAKDNYRANPKIPLVNSPGQTNDLTKFYEYDEQEFIKILFSFFEKVNKNRIIAVICPIIFVLINVVFLRFYTQDVYMSTAKIMPVADGGGGAELSNWAAKKFGVSLGGSKKVSLSSTEMVPAIINSRRLARELLEHKFDTNQYGEDKSLLEILTGQKFESGSWPEHIKKKVISEMTKNIISVEYEGDSPLLYVSVYASEAQFSSDLNIALLNILEKIITQFKQSRIIEQKNFIVNRMVEVKKDLTIAEDELKEFRDRNRNIISSPALLLQQARLLRDVEVQTQVYITLKTEHEMAKIEEVQSSSMIQILDHPEAPTKKLYPRPLRSIILSIFFGISVGVGIIYLKDWLALNRKNFKMV
jgi:capsule polysaccharide export protein KpsE/RkpR